MDVTNNYIQLILVQLMSKSRNSVDTVCDRQTGYLRGFYI